jgi:hypothetical protein
MAENKKSFVLYADLIHTVRKLPEDKAGKLFMTILEYVNDENPKVEDLLVEVSFEPIRQQLKRDLKRYEHKKKMWSEAGKRSAEVRKANKNQQTLTNVDKRSTDLTVNVNDNVNVNVNDNIESRGKSRFTPPTPKEINDYFREKGSSAEEAKKFFYFYESKNWMVGKNKMKKWKSSAGLWISRNTENKKQERLRV